MDYFSKLLDLLKIEQQEDQAAYRRLTESSTVAARRADGITWYPIAIKGTEIGRGDYLAVEVERTTHQDIVHQLRFGASAALFSNHDPKDNRLEGIISHQSGNNLTITLRTDELPDWARDGKLGIDLLFDDNSYDEMRNALKLAARRMDKAEEGRLINILIGEKQPAFQAAPHPAPLATNTAPTTLNAAQRAAVDQILSAEDLAIVHGPPGTGKTTTLVQAIKAMIRQDGRQVLVVAPSNTAVDLLSEQLSDEGLNTLRVGNPARVSQRLMSLTLDARMTQHPGMKEIKRLRKQANEFRDMAHKYKRNFGKAERDQRKALFDEARSIMKAVEQTEQFIIDDLLSKAQVITATLVGANHYTVRNLRFHTVVIDEAGQALEPACWIPIGKAKKLVLAGDHCQLPPTVKSNEAGRNGLNITLLEKCVALHPGSVTLLEEQYRMNEMIMGFSSRVFYQDRLRAHPSVAHRLLFAGDSPLAFVDTAGCGFDERSEGTGTSNPEEAAFLFKHLTQLVTRLNSHHEPPTSTPPTSTPPTSTPPTSTPTSTASSPFPSIAVISPYKLQVELLKEQLSHAPLLKAFQGSISVNTIDSFQGQERDIVYIGMTRSNTDNKIGFLSDIRRMNVAMTRARKKLVVIGDSATLSRLPFYADLIAYAEEQNAYQSAWELV